MGKSLWVKFLSAALIFFSSQSSPQNFWQEISNLDSIGVINSIDFDSEGRLYAAAEHGLFYSVDYGANWSEVINAQFSGGYISDILLVSDTEIFIGTDQKGIFKSSNGGVTWNYCGLESKWVDCLMKDDKGNIYAGTSDKIYRSSNYGESWIKLSNGIDQYVNEVWSLYQTHNGKLLAGTECGLYLSEDEGNNWNFIGSFDCGDITSIQGINNDEKILIGGADRFHGLYFSTDYGYNWNFIQNPDTILWATSMVLVNKNDLYISAMVNGVYKFNQNDGSLTAENNGLDFVIYHGKQWYYVSAMAFDSLGYVYAASDKLYKSANTDNSYRYLENKIYTYSLKQNYPNPFNPTTTIKYSIPVVNENISFTTKVVLKVYDVLGREVVTLVNAYKPAGKYEVDFDGSKYPSGIYFYKLTAGNFSKVKKMILMK